MPDQPSLTLSTGAEMPALGFGTWGLTGPDAVDAVRHALELGYRMVDTSGDYGNEREIGEAVRSAGVDRDAVYLVSKVEPEEDAHASTVERVRGLGVERLDLCLLHRPPGDGTGERSWRGLVRAREEGLTRDIGLSNFAPAQLDALIDATGETPPVNQIEWSPFGHSRDVLEHARARGVALQAYSPLTRGKRLGDATLGEIASRHGRTPAQVMLRWALQLGLAPLPKAADAGHREENLGVFGFELGGEDMERISALDEHYSPVADLPY